jgi:formylglycine-generating enzyme required for sulfatase activity
MRAYKYAAMLLINYLFSFGAIGGAQTPPPGVTFRDCTDHCPYMVVIPPGAMAMTGLHPASAPSSQSIELTEPLAISKYDVTRDEFAAFVDSTDYKAEGCYTYDGGRLPGALFHNDVNANWRNTGFDQSDRDPVVCVNWFDAQAYVNWLSQRTGHHYKLPTEEEWLFASGGGFKGSSRWDAAIVRKHANLGTVYCCRPQAKGRGNWMYTSPVGSFDANVYGLYDMLGNVSQWTETCSKWKSGAATRAKAAAAECEERVLRGGDWSLSTGHAENPALLVGDPTLRETTIGFRVIRTN